MLEKKKKTLKFKNKSLESIHSEEKRMGKNEHSLKIQVANTQAMDY